MIYNFKLFNEKLGIVSGLEEIADIAIENLNNKLYFNLKTKICNIDVDIDFFVISNYHSMGALSSLGGNKFEIKLNKPNKYVIIHELKHLDRMLNRDLTTDDITLIHNISKYLFKKLDFGLKDPIKNKKEEMFDIISFVLYYTSVNEFESNFNEYYYELKDVCKGKNKDEKKKIIDEFLSYKEMYIVNKQIYKTKSANLENIFKNKYYSNDFFKRIIKIMNEHKKEKINKTSIDYLSISTTDKIMTNLKGYFSKEFKGEKDVNNFIKKLENLIIHNATKNYKKLFRLYTLLD